MKLKDTADQHAKQQQQKAEQARINGAKSKGPTSPEGKSKSSRNAIRHGLTANEHTLLESEFPEEYAEVRAAFIDDLRPATKAELRLVEKIANLDWRLERFVMMETALLNITADTNLKEITDHFTRIDGIGIIVEAWKKDHSTTLCLDLLRRYMGTLQHQFNTTLSNFRNFEKARLAKTRQGTNLDEAWGPPYQEPTFNALMKSDIEDPQPSYDEQYGDVLVEPQLPTLTLITPQRNEPRSGKLPPESKRPAA